MSLSTAAITGRGSCVARLRLQPEVRWSQWPPSERSYELQNDRDHLLNFLSFWWIIRSLLRAENRISFPSEIHNLPPLGPCRPGAAATLGSPTFPTTPQCIGSLYRLGIQILFFFYPAVPNNSYIATKKASEVFIRMQLSLVSGKTNWIRN